MAEEDPTRRESESDEQSADLTRDEYFAERRLLIEARQRAYQRTDQMIVAGAAGALALSVSFLERLAPSAPVAAWALPTALALLLASLALALIGQFATGRSFDAEIERLDAIAERKQAPTNAWAKRTTWLTAWSFIGLIIGIGMLVLFAYKNTSINGGID